MQDCSRLDRKGAELSGEQLQGRHEATSQDRKWTRETAGTPDRIRQTGLPSGWRDWLKET